jgi:RNA polymerase sigma factor (sigma-70 family)
VGTIRERSFFPGVGPMIKSPAASAVGLVRDRHASPCAEGMSDGSLLEWFTRRREEAAFAALMRRHGPMVLSVCRRVLAQEHDAEDVFQATFLVLARKAASIGNHQSVGGWLYRVAYRLAAKARTRIARRRQQEAQTELPPRAAPLLEVACRELQNVLDQELQRLPQRYRAPIVLCYLEGRTQEEAAQQLGAPLGTVRSRLARARKLLRVRLSRRGLALSSAAFATLLAALPVEASVPAALFQTTVATTLGQALPAARATVLAHGSLHMAAALKFGILATLLVGLGLIGAWRGWWAASSATPKPAGTAPSEDAPEPPAVPEIRKPAPPLPSTEPTPSGPLVREGSLRLKHETAVRTVALSPNGKFVASGSADHKVRLWSAVTGEELEVFNEHKVGVSCLAFSPDNQVLASGGEDKSVCLYKVTSAEVLRKWVVERSAVNTMAFSPDGASLATGCKDLVILFDTATGTETKCVQAHKGAVVDVRYSPNGDTLASAGVDHAFRMWRGTTLKRTHELVLRDVEPRTVAFTVEGRAVAAGNSRDSVKLWLDLVPARQVPNQQFACSLENVGPVVLSPDARNLAVGAPDASVAVWEVSTGRALYKLAGSKGRVRSISFSADGRTVAAGSEDAGVLLWHLTEAPQAIVPTPGK